MTDQGIYSMTLNQRQREQGVSGILKPPLVENFWKVPLWRF